tara:strand:- start:5111 stop:6475 length:1365 start_codon:yes stop_codon:yes gene_type:complete
MTDLANQIFPWPTEPTPNLPEVPELVTLDSLKIGELNNTEIIEIVESITSLKVDLKADGVSSITFSVYDPDFRMHENNYFLIQRVVEFNGMLYEISNVTLQHAVRDTINVTARNMKMQKIRREKGNHSWGAISPTALARLTAKKHGLGFVGETSAVSGTITRVQNDDNDESTYDVLKKLAKDLEFRFFEAKDFMFFASEDFIVTANETLPKVGGVEYAGQGQIRIFIPGRDAEIDPVTGGYVTDVVFPLNVNLRKDEDSKKPATFNANVHTNATTQQLYPGLGCQFKTVVERFSDNELVTAYEEPFPNYEDLFFIDKVSYNMQPNQPTVISGTSIKPTADMLCTLQEFKQGSKGTCVKRIQHAVGMADADVTGIFDSATTEAVTTFQNANILQYSDNPLFADGNWANYVELGVVGKVTWEWIKAINMSEVTVPVPVLRGIDADDEIDTRGLPSS